MQSFIVSVIVFVVLVLVLAFWQRRVRRTVEVDTSKIEHEINAAAEIAQRRHKQRFGRASTGLEEAIHRPHPKS
jgi:uncharacterized membrane protein